MAIPVPATLRRCWSRRWFRRVTYLLAAGTVAAGLGAWLVQRPSVDRWIVSRLDVLLRAETGLGFQAERLEVHPFTGRVILYHPAVGGDLFQAERLEVVLDLPSLTGTPHLKELLVISPRIVLDQARLEQIRLKPHPPRPDTPTARLDRLEISDGQASLRSPAWGLPPATCSFSVQGRGWKADQLRLQVLLPQLALGAGSARLQGRLGFALEATPRRLDLDHGALSLGGNRLAFQGSYRIKSRFLEAVAEGGADLAELARLAGKGAAAPVSGQLTFKAKTLGTLDKLAWNTQFQAAELRFPGQPLQPASLHASIWGDPGRVRLDRLEWHSADGSLEAAGAWAAKAGTSLELTALGGLAPVAVLARAPYLERLQGKLEGQLKLPTAPWERPRLEQVQFQGSGQFSQDGKQVGAVALQLGNNRLQARTLDLNLAEGEFHGEADATLGPAGVTSIQATGQVSTDAAQVAAALTAWHVVDLDMAGQTRARADFRWQAGHGIRLAGDVDIVQPRWHEARADHVQAKVTIEDGDLRVADLVLDKDAGRAWGDLWLSWANLPKGSEQIDMCYRFDRLPIKEGLRAGDQGELPITGTGSGWVRLHGPYQHLLMEGNALAVDSQAYGFKLPAVSADFFMDIAKLRLKTTDVRAADSIAHLGLGDQPPSGPLAVQGSMDMDIPHATWQVQVAGALDSTTLGLPGPHLQGRMQGRLDGPFTAPFGPIQVPEGAFTLSAGRITQGERSLEGLEGSLSFRDGQLDFQAGLAGMPQRLVDVQAMQLGPSRLEGAVRVNLGPDSANTALLATRLSDNFLKDANLDYAGRLDWDAAGMRWQGLLNKALGSFEGFQLGLSRPGRLDGDLTGLNLAVELEGRGVTPFPSGGPVLPPAPTASQVALSGRVPFAGDRPLALKLSGSAELANLKTILDHLVQPSQYSLLAEMQPGGSARVDLNLGGTLDEATLDGTLNLKGGRVFVRTYPQSVENLDFTATFHGRDISIPESDPLTGSLAQGRLKAWGQVTWHLGGLSAYGLHASLDDFQLRDLPEGFELEGSLKADLDGNDEQGGLLKGSLRTKRVLYHADINLNDLILAGALGGAPGLSTVDPSDPLSRIDLDLDLQMTEPWELDTNLVKLQGRPVGPFRIKGNLTRPGLLGKMDFIPGGRLTNLFPAGDIVLEQGNVDFKDASSFNPNIDVMGRVDVTPYLVTLKIAGTLDHTQFIPSSTPSLRQDEIFAILLDPDAVRTVGSSPGFSSQAAMNTGLASTSTSLLTSLALANLQERLRKTLKLDRVSVAFSSGLGGPESSVVLGKTYNIFGHRTPIVFTHRKTGEATTISSQVEWRFGDLVLQLGVSQSTADSMHPSGEIRHTWSPP